MFLDRPEEEVLGMNPVKKLFRNNPPPNTSFSFERPVGFNQKQ